MVKPMKIKYIIFFLIYIIFFSTTAFSAGQFVTFKEITDNGDIIELSENTSHYDVDINSFVDVNFHPDTLLVNNSENNAELKKLNEKLKSAGDLLQDANSKIKIYLDDINNLRSKLLTNYDTETEKKYWNALANHGKLIDNIIDFATDAAGDQKVDEALRNEDPLYTKLIALISEHINNLNKSLQEQTKAIISKNQITMNVWCIQQSRDKSSIAIHLNNYDNLEEGSFHLIDKVTTSISTEENIRLKESLQFHESLKNSINEIKKDMPDIKASLTSFKDRLITELNTFKKNINLNNIEKQLDDLENKLQHSAADTSTKEIVKNIDELKDEIKSIIKLSDNIADIKNIFENTDEQNLLILVNNFKNKIDDLIAAVKDIQNVRINKITAIVQNLKKSFEQISESSIVKMSSDIFDLIKANSQQLTGLFQDASSKFAKYKENFTNLNFNLGFAKEISTINSDIDIPKEARSVNISNAMPTTINIPKSSRQENDIYYLYAKVYKNNSIIFNQDYSFRVMKYGAYSKWASSLLFTEGEGQSSFQPAASVSWIIHHRSRKTIDKNGKQSGGKKMLGDLIDFGIGFNSVVLSSNDKVEYGLGVVATFLGDIIQVGYGLNLQKTGNKGYLFIGASLFDILNPVKK